MAALRRNVIANFLGKGWSALMGLAFIPLYIRFMGVEAFGLVGFYATLQAVFALLDLGLTTTLNRELARYSGLSDQAQQMRDLVRTLEGVYWALALLIAVISLTLAPFIAHQWVRAETLPVGVVEQAVALMGLVLAFQFPVGFYSGGLLGMQRQVFCSALNAGWYTLRFAGAVVVLWLVSPTILAFFIWQAAVSASAALLSAIALWRSLPASPRAPRFQMALLRSVWRFATGMSVISATVLILTQLDKLVLSKLLPLEAFGYYSLAWVVASGLSALVSPIFTALFPRFSRTVALGDLATLTRLYHSGCQLMSVAILPVTVVVALFAPQILLLWTRDPKTVEQTHLLVSLLIVGTALNGLMNLPYALQLAYGWTALTVWINVVSIVILAPALILLAPRFGAVGAASSWVMLNGGYVFVELQIMHRKLLPGEKWHWYLQDTGLPLVATLLVVLLGRSLFLFAGQSDSIGVLAWLVGVSGVTVFAVALVTPMTGRLLRSAVSAKTLSGFTSLFRRST